MSGIRDDFKGLASSMTDNFQKLTSKLSQNNRDLDDESSNESSSSEDDEYFEPVHSKSAHFISDGDSEVNSKSGDGTGKTPGFSNSQTQEVKSGVGSTPPPNTPVITGEEKRSIFAKKRALITPAKDTGDPLDEDLSMILADKSKRDTQGRFPRCYESHSATGKHCGPPCPSNSRSVVE